MPNLEYADGVAKLPHYTKFREKLIPTELMKLGSMINSDFLHLNAYSTIRRR